MEDNDDNSGVFASPSRICSPRIEANWPSQRQRRTRADATASPQRAVITSRGCHDAEEFFDPEHRALRAVVLSLARDGHRLIDQSARNHRKPDSRALGRLLERIDQLDLGLADRPGAPVKQWARQLKCLLLGRAGSHN